MPDSASLRKLREKILENPKEFKKILSEKKFKSLFSELSDLKVKTVPRGFSKDHPEIELLKYTCEHTLLKYLEHLWETVIPKEASPILRHFLN